MAQGADEAPLGRRPQNRRPGRRQQEIGAAGPEAGDDDTSSPFGHPTGCVGLPGVPGSSPGSGSVVGGLSERCVLGLGATGGTTTGAWPVAGASNVPYRLSTVIPDEVSAC